MKLYKVFYRVNDKEDSVGVYVDWCFSDLYRRVLHELKFKTLLEAELAAFDGDEPFARGTASIYNDCGYIAQLAVESINGQRLIMVIRRGDKKSTIIRCDWN